MNDEEISNWTGHALRAYRKVPNNRSYSFDPQNSLTMAATAKAFAEQLGDKWTEPLLENFMKTLAQEIPELRQQRPGDPEPVPEIPKDPITGQTCVNPYTVGDHGDLASIAILEEKFPALAGHLKRTPGPRFFVQIPERDSGQRSGARGSKAVVLHRQTMSGMYS
jgi:hypothetical protein